MVQMQALHSKTIFDLNELDLQNGLLKTNYIKSPLNYIGGKYKLLDQILPLFPIQINNFVDLFAGGGNVGVNVNAKKIILNDNLTHLMDMYKLLSTLKIDDTLIYIENQIKIYSLSKENDLGYKIFREKYNSEKYPLDLLILIFFSFNHQIRFNNSHNYNNPFGKNRSSYNKNIKTNLINFIMEIQKKNIKFHSQSFEIFDFDSLGNNDFVYCDPPYLISTSSYNDGKRGFNGWSDIEERLLLKKLDLLNSKNVKFALSNVLSHKGKENNILMNWLNNSEYEINFLNKNYTNSSYNTKNKNPISSMEVLITNYSKIDMV